MELIKNELIGQDTEILLTKKDKTYFVSICVSNLEKGYGNQLYCDFQTEEEAIMYYEALSYLKEQD